MTSNKNEPNDPNSTFKVYIRVRPLNEEELKLNSSKDFISYNEEEISVKIRSEKQVFTFDKVFHPRSSQK